MPRETAALALSRCGVGLAIRQRARHVLALRKDESTLVQRLLDHNRPGPRGRNCSARPRSCPNLKELEASHQMGRFQEVSREDQPAPARAQVRLFCRWCS